LVLFLLGSGLLVLAVASVLPGLVPGAMCGTGVLQAAGPLGSRALGLRGVALAALFGWSLLDRLDRGHPMSPLASAAARALLLAAPVVLLAVVDSERAFLTLDGQEPVDCCAVVYDAVRSGEASTFRPTVSWTTWMNVSAAPLLVTALALALRRPGRQGWWSRLNPWLLAACSLVWLPLAALALVRELAAYHYGVLAHDCPFCLFVVRHRCVGSPLFGALLLVALEGMAAAIAARVGARFMVVQEAAADRARQAGMRVAVGTALFLALALWPAVVWRLHHGLWME
jgi:hypothetical protein